MLREYTYIQSTSSICPVCLLKIDAKIIEENNSVFLLKICPEHGSFKEILEESSAWFYKRNDYNKPGNTILPQNEIKKGCPYDCGLCPNHEQHTCIALIEITSRCNLKCPVCFANSEDGELLKKEKFIQMLDFYVKSENGNAEILQISGGEPTLHPDIIDFIKIAREKGVKYVMINTNGIRIANDIEFVKELSFFKGGFEIYLQFDGFKDSTYQYFRGSNLYQTKIKAIENLVKYEIPITLVSTVETGVNDDELGQLIHFGLQQKYIRGINIQPVAYFGRGSKQPGLKRLTISGIIRKIEEQTSRMIYKDDFIPLPCNVDRVAITYLLKNKDTFIPILRNLNSKNYLPYIRNTFKFDPEDFMNDLSKNLLTEECCNIPSLLKGFRKIIPLSYFTKSEAEKIGFVNDNTFRISITSFIDSYNFEVKSVQKECVHIITPEMKKIPFSTYNMLYRNEL